MARTAARREKWTLSFDAGLKRFLVKTREATLRLSRHLLEEIVQEKLNPYGHTDLKDSVAYVRLLRRRSRRTSDESFLKEVRAW